VDIRGGEKRRMNRAICRYGLIIRDTMCMCSHADVYRALLLKTDEAFSLFLLSRFVFRWARSAMDVIVM
jgi:hypothetical protein